MNVEEEIDNIKKSLEALEKFKEEIHEHVFNHPLKSLINEQLSELKQELDLIIHNIGFQERDRNNPMTLSVRLQYLENSADPFILKYHSQEIPKIREVLRDHLKAHVRIAEEQIDPTILQTELFEWFDNEIKKQLKRLEGETSECSCDHNKDNPSKEGKRNEHTDLIPSEPLVEDYTDNYPDYDLPEAKEEPEYKIVVDKITGVKNYLKKEPPHVLRIKEIVYSDGGILRDCSDLIVVKKADLEEVIEFWRDNIEPTFFYDEETNTLMNILNSKMKKLKKYLSEEK